MGRFLGGLFETKTVVSGQGQGQSISRAVSQSPSRHGTWASTGPWDVDKAVNDAYERDYMVYRCVDAIAVNQSSIPLLHRKGDARTGRLLQSPRLMRLLNVRPNIYETAAQFRYRLTAQALLSRKGVFIECVGGVNNPEALHLLPPQSVEPIPGVPVYDNQGQLISQNFVDGYRVRSSDMGETVLLPDQVIWLKLKPHPIDPYQQMTPLVAAGIAVETDILARMFNRNFLQNDGRPGLLVSVRGQLPPEDAMEIKRRFAGGPTQAGQTTVIESDGLDVVDLGATPRDAQWTESIATSKQDIMLAFGVPESVLGNASGRTFDNADAEYEMFWTHTMLPHCEAIAGALDSFTGSNTDDEVIAFDYSKVDVLQRQERRRKDAIVADFQAGVITWEEMRTALQMEIWPDSLATRVVMVPGGWMAAKNKADQEKIMDLANIAKIAPPAPEGPPGGDQQLPPFAALAQGGAQLQSINGGRVQNALASRALALAGKAAVTAEQIETPEGDAVPFDRKDDVIDVAVVHPYEQQLKTVENILTGVMLGVSTRQEDVICDRLGHAKCRKGTRHWDYEEKISPPYPYRDLDPEYAVEVDRWVREVLDNFSKVLTPMLRREAKRVVKDIRDNGYIPVSNEDLGLIQRAALDSALDMVDKAVRNQAGRIAALIQKRDQEGASLDDIKKEVRRLVNTRGKWHKQLSGHAIIAAVEGTKNGIYSTVPGVRKTWNTESDERVRDSHWDVDGKTISVRSKFKVGEALMAFPHDPTGPVQEVANCFPADTLVEAGSIDGAYRRWYSGPMIEVTTREGKRLTGTPNHPVLTDQGWVALHTLAKEDNLVCYSNDIDVPVGHDVDGSPTKIGKVFDSLTMLGDLVRVSGSGVNFHGDLAHGDVDVVLVNSQLRRDIQTSADEFIEQLLFPSSDPVLAGLTGQRTTDLCLVTVGRTTSGLISTGSKRLALVGIDVSHSHRHGATTITGSDTMTDKERSESVSSDTELLSQGLLGLSGKISVDNVVGVRRIELWSGHVYNLSTASGTYVSNGIVAHNCRCWLTFSM